MAITLKQIKSRVSEVAKLGTSYNTYIHETAIMIFHHAAPKAVSPDCQGSGDCSQSLSLVKAMPASMRRTMLVQWFKDYTPIRIKLSENGDKCGFDPAYLKLPKDSEERLAYWKHEEACEVSFADLSEATPEEKPALSFSDILKMVERLSSQIEKKIADNKVLPEDIESAKMVARTIEGLRLARVAPAEQKKAANEVTEEVGEKEAA